MFQDFIQSLSWRGDITKEIKIDSRENNLGFSTCKFFIYDYIFDMHNFGLFSEIWMLKYLFFTTFFCIN